jgi:hypothetical protein
VDAWVVEAEMVLLNHRGEQRLGTQSVCRSKGGIASMLEAFVSFRVAIIEVLLSGYKGRLD